MCSSQMWGGGGGGGGGGGDKSYIILTEVLFMQNLMSLSSGCR